ncbi:hypothetical protein HNO91_12135 [Pseudomonas corrugata]|uniref:Uncharacterized protein n=1 Tax=Pseudomonas corrugata TaxID=47879 RepID=A0A7Y6DHJ1_9PSED|nr:hypothetical protein [Pseudomonas corrugata]MDU9039991.1 hypothetical protein [Pseudomonas corrugata]NUT87176.1 hypothetical protein [Pseudomonas corrugata]
MRLDQIERLKALSEGLADVVLDEANPKNWPGTGKTLAELTRDERGDRHWCKKNAAATMTLLVKVMSITGHVQGGTLPGGTTEEDLDAMQDKAEREATALLERAQAGVHVH